MSDFLRVTKSVFSNKNILTIAITTSLISLTDMGWRTFWGLYLMNDLGASYANVGLLSTIASSERLLFQLPGGLLADKFGRRKIIVWGTALRLLPPVLYLMAGHWTQVIPALLISGAASIYMPAFNAIIADSLPQDERGAGYGAYRTITSLPQIFSPIIGGYLMDRFGYATGVKIFLYISFFTTIFVTYARWKVLRETLDDDEPTQKEETEDKPSMLEYVKGSFELPKSVWAMVAVSIFSAFGMRIVWDFLPIYAVEVIGLSNTQLGVVATTGGILSAVLAMPGGMISDKFGRKPLILGSRFITPITMFLVTLSQTYSHYFTVQFLANIANALGGGGIYVGGPAWNALIADLVPREKRGTVMGTMGTLSGIIATPSSWLGGWMWENINPQAPFYVSVVLGLVGTGVFAVFVKEPRRREE